MNSALECIALAVALWQPQPGEEPRLVLKPPRRDQRGRRVLELIVSIDYDPKRSRSVTVVSGGRRIAPCTLLARALRDELAGRNVKKGKAS